MGSVSRLMIVSYRTTVRVFAATQIRPRKKPPSIWQGVSEQMSSLMPMGRQTFWAVRGDFREVGTLAMGVSHVLS